MNDEKKSALLIKEGIKLLQKRSNPVELFVQKRVSSRPFQSRWQNWYPFLVANLQLDYVKKSPPTVATAHILIMELLYLWITLPLCEVPILRKMLQSKSSSRVLRPNELYSSISSRKFDYENLLAIEMFGRNSKDDNKLRPIICLIEGAIHNILLQYDDAQNVGLDAWWIHRFSFSPLHIHSAMRKHWLERKIPNWISLATSRLSRHANSASSNISPVK